MRVVGAGLGRTGTTSLQTALQRLLDGRCYHMGEVFGRPDDIPVWRRAAGGDLPDWDLLFADYVATVDWPAAAFWRELSAHHPTAVVLLSVREDAATWWRSVDRTIFEAARREPPPGLEAWHGMWTEVARHRFTERWLDPEPAMAAYDRHNDEVRATIPAERLVQWRPGDGWEPLCAALDLPVPEEPFPHLNTTEDFRNMTGFDLTAD
ncbi:sulfotransferase family protein [soil metagenome]